MTFNKKILGSLVLTALLASCGSSEKPVSKENNKTKEITVYTALENEQIPEYLQSFKEQYPNIKLNIVRESTGVIVSRVLDVAEAGDDYTMIPMQGSGTFFVEAVLTTVVGENEKVLILSNGTYGERMKTICDTAKVKNAIYKIEQTETYDLTHLENILKEDKEITHVAVVHYETTSEILNPIKEIGIVVKNYNKTFIVDAMSSFGGIHFNIPEYQIDFLISSSNKCIQGVPGFGFIIAKQSELLKCEGKARSHSLDIFDQWKVMESGNGKWRFTSPTHVVRAFYQALLELEAEGGVKSREKDIKKTKINLLTVWKLLDLKLSSL